MKVHIRGVRAEMLWSACTVASDYDTEFDPKAQHAGCRFVTAQSEVARLEKKFADALAPFWPVINGSVYAGELAKAIEIPFVFNNLSSWAVSPMLKGANAETSKGLADAMHGAWIAFARTGRRIIFACRRGRLAA